MKINVIKRLYKIMKTTQRIEEILKQFREYFMTNEILKLMLEALVLQAQLEQLQGRGGINI